MVLTRLGKKTIERIMCVVFNFHVKRRANNKPRTVFNPDVRKAYRSVFFMPILREYSEKKVLKLYKPTKRNSVSDQIVRLKKNEINVGIIKKTVKRITSGKINHLLYSLLFISVHPMEKTANAVFSEESPKTQPGYW